MPDVESPSSSAFIDAPWETLHDGRRFWAAEPNLGFGPYRRIGEPEGAPPAPTGGLQTLFMAAAPIDVPELSFEAEEQAILSATAACRSRSRLKRPVPRKAFGFRASRLVPPPAVVHLSCHGGSSSESKGRPFLRVGRLHYGRKAELRRRCAELTDGRSQRNTGLGPGVPVSLPHRSRKCAGDEAANSSSRCAQDLIRRGQKAVLGWAGSVLDGEATRFAATLYQTAGARGQPLRCRDGCPARRFSFQPPAGHTAESRLASSRGCIFGSERGRGASTAQGAKPPLRQAVTKAFLDPRKEVAVASPDRFVGRRRPLQTALRVLEGQDHGGLLIHGVGRQGKSSIAARIADRLQGTHQLAVVFGTYTARYVVEQIAEAYLDNPDVQAWKQQHLDAVDQTPESFEAALSTLLAGPLSGQDAGVKPLLLVVDDFEQALEEPTATDTPVRVVTQPKAVRPTVRALLKAFRPDKTHSRVVFTSRLRFVFDEGGKDLVDGLYPLSLPGMSTGEAEKQVRARDAVTARLRRDEVARYTKAALGNPGLLDVLLGLSELDDGGVTAARALQDMEARAAGQGVDVESPELRQTLERIAVGALLDALTPSEQLRVKVSSVFEDSPVPSKAMTTLCAALGP